MTGCSAIAAPDSSRGNGFDAGDEAIVYETYQNLGWQIKKDRTFVKLKSLRRWWLRGLNVCENLLTNFSKGWGIL